MSALYFHSLFFKFFFCLIRFPKYKCNAYKSADWNDCAGNRQNYMRGITEHDVLGIIVINEYGYNFTHFGLIIMRSCVAGFAVFLTIYFVFDYFVVVCLYKVAERRIIVFVNYLIVHYDRVSLSVTTCLNLPDRQIYAYRKKGNEYKQKEQTAE